MAKIDWRQVQAPRLGSGNGWLILGGLVLAVAVVAAAAGDAGAAGLTALFAGGLIAVGFWTKLFSAVELRLIEIEKWMKRPPEGEPEPSVQAGPAEPDNYLG